MEFFISSESDGRYDNFDDALRRVGNIVSQTIERNLKDKNYGDEVSLIAIIPIIIKFDPVMEQEGWFKERILFSKKTKEADLRLKVDYDRFVQGDDEVKKKLLVDVIIRSIRELAKKVKGNFKFKEMEQDILNLFNYKLDDF